VRYLALYKEEILRMSGDPKGPVGERAVGEPEPALRGGGLQLPGLKRLHLRRGLSQAELARRADLSQHYLSKIESGQRGCNPEAAHELAAVLEVDLQELRTKRDDAEDLQEAPRPLRPRIAYRQVHQAYLRILLLRAVGSAYAAMDEREIEKHCEKSSWEEVIEVVWARKREIESLGEVMGDERVSADLPAEVRSFLEAVLEGYPDQDIRLLAAARRREPSKEGREALTKAMRNLL
jgi:transcriptional regulator with XRE-family HTH domain